MQNIYRVYRYICIIKKVCAIKHIIIVDENVKKVVLLVALNSHLLNIELFPKESFLAYFLFKITA